MSERECSKCHWGWALIAGLTAGLTAGLYLKSEEGEKMADDAKNVAHKLQKDLMKKWKATEHFSKTKYEATVKEIVDQYRKTKKLAAHEVAEVQEFLLKQWDEVQGKLIK